MVDMLRTTDMRNIYIMPENLKTGSPHGRPMCEANIPSKQISNEYGIHPVLVLCPSWFLKMWA